MKKRFLLKKIIFCKILVLFLVVGFACAELEQQRLINLSESRIEEMNRRDSEKYGAAYLKLIAFLESTDIPGRWVGISDEIERLYLNPAPGNFDEKVSHIKSNSEVFTEQFCAFANISEASFAYLFEGLDLLEGHDNYSIVIKQAVLNYNDFYAMRHKTDDMPTVLAR